MAKKKQTPVELPPPAQLERICKGIAALDAMLSEEWEDRYYSFNAAWDPKRKQRMASMRNGSGDDWFILFEKGGTFFKSFWHEHEPQKVAALYAGIPAALRPQLKEPAFMMKYVTFGGFHDGVGWTLRGNPRPLKEDLAILSGDPAAYCAYAREYFGAKLPKDAVAHVLAGQKLTPKLVARIADERTLRELKDDLAEIGY